jgi:hypothetical protein
MSKAEQVIKYCNIEYVEGFIEELDKLEKTQVIEQQAARDLAAEATTKLA